MRTTIGTLAAALACAAGCQEVQETSVLAARTGAQYQVVGVESGDTIVVRFDDAGMEYGAEDVRVRLHGCRAPTPGGAESGAPREYLGAEARLRLARLLGDGWVRLEFPNAENRPARLEDDRESLAPAQSAFVFVPPSPEAPMRPEVCANVWCLEEGLARRDPTVHTATGGDPGDYLARCDAAEARARAASRGLWALLIG